MYIILNILKFLNNTLCYINELYVESYHNMTNTYNDSFDIYNYYIQ